MSRPPGLLSIVVPAYNEEQRLGPTLDRIAAFLDERKWPAEVLVVDDGSRDGTAALAERAAAQSGGRVQLLRNPVNAGKGESVRRGVTAARGDVVLFTDADLSTPIEEVDKLLAALAAGHDVAIGSRAVAGARVEVHQAWYRELMGKSFNLLVRLLSGLPLSDTQCGFKAFSADAARAIFPRQRVPGFGFDVELLFLARRLGLRIAEVPVVWRNSPFSRVHPVLDSARMARDLVLIRLRAWRGLYD